MARLGRLPIRVRVTLAFAGVMALVLAATGAFLLLRLGAELDATIEQGLRGRAQDIAALVRETDSGLDERRGALTEEGESAAQILGPSGEVVDATPGFARRPLLSPDELDRALGTTLVLDKPVPEDPEDVVRVLATPVRDDEGRLVVVVAAGLDVREDALSRLTRLLLIGGPIALLLASLAGYGAAAAALRPVERMRRRAADIRTAAAGQRLPVPAAHDEIGRLGATLNEMLARLEAAFARERAFVADAGHELRTPLAILKAELELARRRGRSPEELRAALSSAEEETDRLVRLAEDLLVIARSDQGRLPLRPEPVDAGELVRGVRERFAARARELGASLSVTAPDGLQLVADPLRLDQALGNLLDNALRHGGTAIALEAGAAGDGVRLAVRDDGPGFSPDFLPAAFERFTRGDQARGRGGAGLGLAIVAAVAEAHGGRAGARNLPEGGAEAWVELPPATAGAAGPAAGDAMVRR